MIRFLQCLFKKKSQRRSVVFYRHSYYHFYYLAEALRKRGWDAIVVNLEPQNGINSLYYHGEDLNIFHKNPKKFKKNISKFYKKAKKRFKLMHFAGDGYLSFFPEHHDKKDPWDIIEWKSINNKVAYTISGCLSGTSQTSVSAWSIRDNGLNVCDRCVWQHDEKVCNNTSNLAWGEKVQKHCDLIFSETIPALDYMKTSDKVIREPTTMCLDPFFWHPNLEIPEHLIISKEPGEVLIYHAVGNYDYRNTDDRNIKGTPYIVAAVDRLKSEGFNVRLIFFTNIPNTEVRFYQAQADIIVDQLNYGRYGATAREGMMLGKPVVCYINTFEYDDNDKLISLGECPLISASEQEVYDAIKGLVINPEKRTEVGKRGREYALKWHSADACAERYEQYFDTLFKLD